MRAVRLRNNIIGHGSEPKNERDIKNEMEQLIFFWDNSGFRVK